MRLQTISGYCKEKNLISLLKKADWQKLTGRNIRRFTAIDVAGSCLFETPPGPTSPVIRITVRAVPDAGEFKIVGYGHTPDVAHKEMLKKAREERDKILICGYFLRNLTLQQLAEEKDLWPYECTIELIR